MISAEVITKDHSLRILENNHLELLYLLLIVKQELNPFLDKYGNISKFLWII